MESVFLKNSPDDLLRKKYNNADWVLRKKTLQQFDFPIAFDKSRGRKKINKSLDVFIDTFFEGFESQNQQCQYEIVVIDLQDINVSASEIDKTAKIMSPMKLGAQKKTLQQFGISCCIRQKCGTKQSVGGVDSSEILYAVWFE
uniref:Uncharacterized protein n=1 Tax=Ditylenchus dipsaci TaxID=166011 RepID=A0A915CWQ3_9BILA